MALHVVVVPKDASDRIVMLENLILSFPKYIDNWSWYQENEGSLRTIPGFRMPFVNDVDYPISESEK